LGLSPFIGLRNGSGSLAMFAAIRLASSRVSRAAEPVARLILEIDIGELLSVVIAHDKARGLFFDRPRWREAAGGQFSVSVWLMAH
jgi:hypothetical protein